MSSRGTADVVFVVDASGSMRPCIDAVRAHIGAFVAGLTGQGQTTWDLRLDFLAHAAAPEGGGTSFRMSSVFHPEVTTPLYANRSIGFQQQAAGRFFTTDTRQFTEALGAITAAGDEAPLVALDTALDFPWRDTAGCHRVMVMLTDEPFETGLEIPWQRSKLKDLVQKIQDLKVMLFLVAPDSELFTELSAVERCEYEVAELVGDGLSSVDFKKLMAAIGRSVSASRQLGGPRPAVRRGLFEQAQWGFSEGSADWGGTR